MSVRIFKPSKSAMQSGMSGPNKHWYLVFDHKEPETIDPLMGWTGTSETERQICLTFETKEAAEDYARRKGLDYIVEEPKARKTRRASYSDNFSVNRAVPWTH